MSSCWGGEGKKREKKNLSAELWGPWGRASEGWMKERGLGGHGQGRGGCAPARSGLCSQDQGRTRDLGWSWGFHPHRPQQMFVGLSPPRSSPAPAPAGNSSVLRKKKRRGQGADPGGAVLEEAALPLGPAVPPGCGSSPRFFGGLGSPPGRRAAPRPRCCHRAQQWLLSFFKPGDFLFLFPLFLPIPGADLYREQRISLFFSCSFCT